MPPTVEAMRLMLEAQAPADYMVATGRAHSVGDVCQTAFAHVGLDWRQHVEVDSKLVRVPETGSVNRQPAPGRS